MSERHQGVSAPKAEANFALRMKLLREARGLSQAEIATRLSRMGVAVPQQTIARIETGKRSLRLDEATAIARALNADLLDMVQDPVEVGNAREQLAEAIKQHQRAYDDRLNAESVLRSAETEVASLASELTYYREEEAHLQVVIEQLKAAVAELDREGPE
ncbi:helix-turn-helix transcriptional regulator [Streptomyces sp. NPDC054771]